MYYNLAVNLLLSTFVFLFVCTQDSACIKEEYRGCMKKHQCLLNDKELPEQIAKHILTTFEDSRGNLWFGTYDKGVARYDGTSLRYFTEADGLCGNTVANIAEDKEGYLWFGTYSDMCRLDLKISNNDPLKFISYPKDKEGKPMLGWGWKSVKTDAKGNIWVNSHHGIFQCIDGAFIEFKIKVNVSEHQSFCSSPGLVSMDLEDHNGHLWFGTDGDGVYMYDGSEYIHYTMADGLPSNVVTDIEEDKEGNIWIACRKSMQDSKMIATGGLCRLDRRQQKAQITTFKDQKGLFGHNIHTLYRDPQGDIWVGATGVGVYCFHSSLDEDFSLYNEPAGVDLSDTFIIDGLQSMLEDSQGKIWIGYSGGLYQLSGDEIINITSAMLNKAH